MDLPDLHDGWNYSTCPLALALSLFLWTLHAFDLSKLLS